MTSSDGPQVTFEPAMMPGWPCAETWCDDRGTVDMVIKAMTSEVRVILCQEHYLRYHAVAVA